MLKDTVFPPNPLVPPAVLKQKAHAELTDFLAAKDVRSRITEGFNIIFRELSLHEIPLLVESIREE